MNLDRVTITGADDSVRPDQIVDLSREYPFVEWGILASRSSRNGSLRFPSNQWISTLQNHVEVCHTAPRLSLHLCGQWVRQLLVGVNEVPPWMFHGFRRVQLNFHAENVPMELDDCCEALYGLMRQLIFQVDGVNGNAYLNQVLEKDDRIDAVGLFDLSGGIGQLPGSWPSPPDNVEYYGYAGGLSPDNLNQELQSIGEAAGDTRFWIDVETHVRSDNDKRFDLEKVKAFLEIAKPYVHPDWRNPA